MPLQQLQAMFDAYALVQAQKAAISEQLAQAKRNFEVGTATITDNDTAKISFSTPTSSAGEGTAAREATVKLVITDNGTTGTPAERAMRERRALYEARRPYRR